MNRRRTLTFIGIALFVFGCEGVPAPAPTSHPLTVNQGFGITRVIPFGL